MDGASAMGRKPHLRSIGSTPGPLAAPRHIEGGTPLLFFKD